MYLIIIVITYLQASQVEEEETLKHDPTDYYSGFEEGDFFPPIRKSQDNFTPPSHPPMRKALSDPMPSRNIGTYKSDQGPSFSNVYGSNSQYPAYSFYHPTTSSSTSCVTIYI